MTIDEFKKKIVPHMEKGYVAMDKDCSYWYFGDKPRKARKHWKCTGLTVSFLPKIFNIEPVEDWTQSLIEVRKRVNPK